MLFNRISCLRRVTRRYRKYRGQTRPDMGEGCNEKLDADFVKWILWKGRKRKNWKKFKALAEQYPQKTVIIRNQRQLERFYKEQEI